MAKMFLSISDAEYYSDNRYGAFLESMCSAAGNDCILVFRGHVCCIRYDGIHEGKGEYSLILFKTIDRCDHADIITVRKEDGLDEKVSCYKYLGYRLMEIFRKLYPELNDRDFPVSELKMWFEIDYTSHVIEEDD
ncbi:hypothetical protein [Photobacterium kishitanii]|uniref:Uncharacterized protein n=1 Tax=Photobacterium kishitanii TaxID=318456 RepID=A0A2T3KL26_9GAMM|nr:hypothetical protein [Photobacterium kishitanii]PSV00359.1 hypothetical protein C9J27_04325 [Photobacterium kishitanii]